MAEIPNELLAQLHTALMRLGDAPQDVTDPIREKLGVGTSMALDDLLAASYQIVEAAGRPVIFPPAA
ncbi:hypothetical protein O4J55_21825 [Paracoccus sp. PXZ]